jgi:uncharacterized membrane-anchored protein YitT (DUF2179 family)
MSNHPNQTDTASRVAADSRHTLFEDVQALLTGTLVVALGIAMYKKAGLVTGGVTGIAFLSHYASGINFSLLLVGLNLPFYAFALKRMGLVFTLKSLIAVTLVALFTELSPSLIRFEWLHPMVAGVVGGLLVGVGMLILFRHKSSLGGFGVVSLYLQETRGWRAGNVQMVLDGVILLGSVFIVSPMLIVVSVVSAVVLNLTLATNHRRDRYLAV